MDAIKDVLDIQGASEFLDISDRTLRKLLREGVIPGRKIGREWRFSRQALIEWLSKGSSKD